MLNPDAFSSRRYRYTLDHGTVRVILEPRYPTSPRDRRIAVVAPDRAASGGADAVILYGGTMHLVPQAVPATAR